MKLFRPRKVHFLASFLSCLFSPTLAWAVGPDPALDRDGSDPIEERAEWFKSRRRWPDGTLPAGLRLRAVDEKIRAAQRLQQGLGKDGRRVGPPPSWTSIGPRPTDVQSSSHVAGRVTALAVDPRDRDVVYLGGAAGGVWKTVDGGRNWAPLTDDQPSIAIGAIALDPSNPDIVYVGTGEANYGADEYFGSGLLKSTDAGASWQQIRGPFAELRDPRFGTSAIASIAVDPSDPQIVLVGAYFFTEEQSFSGIYRSEDAGLTWSMIPVLPGGTPTEIYFTPTGELVYTAIGYGLGSPSNGVYRSFDHGVSWSAINGVPPDTIPTGIATGRIELALDLTDPRAQTLYATVPGSARSAPLFGLYKSVDGGEHWDALVTPPGCTGGCRSNNLLRIHPVHNNFLLYGGIYFWISPDGGFTWLFAFNTSHVDYHVFAFSNETTPKLYVGHDQGVFFNDDVARFPVGPYHELNDTLTLTQFYPGLSIHPANPAITLAGSQDTGTLQYAGTLTWQYRTCGDGAETAIDFETPSNVYASCQRISVQRSTNGGQTFSPAVRGIDTTDAVQFIAPLVMDPSNPMRLYFGTFRVYRTENGAQDWNPISPALAADSLTTIAVAPSDPNFVYAGMVGATALSRDALDPNPSWEVAGSGLPPARTVNQLAISPTDPQVAFAAVGGFSGFLGDTLGHVFQTVDGGSTWADISGDLPNIPVNDVVVDPARDGTLYIGTDIGVYVSVNQGGSWLPLGSALPNVPVLSLKVHSSGILRAATHGRGAWDLNLGPTLAHLAEISSEE